MMDMYPKSEDRIPPDRENEITDDERIWVDDIYWATNNNDKCSKPTIATVHFENDTRPILYDKNDYVPPYDFKDEDDRLMDRKEVFRDVTNILHNHDTQ